MYTELAGTFDVQVSNSRQTIAPRPCGRGPGKWHQLQPLAPSPGLPGRRLQHAETKLTGVFTSNIVST